MKCWCYECLKDVPAVEQYVNGLTVPMTRMILCPDCGNKRCPRATDHRLHCTNSNEPGQMGSTYGIYPHTNKVLFDFLEKGKHD